MVRNITISGGSKMELNDIRAKIDAIDDELVSLFARRMDLALEVAKYKGRMGRQSNKTRA